VHSTPPDVARPDAGIVAVTEFALTGAAQQRLLLETSRRAWETLPWPETMLGISWLTALDGTGALAYVQWTDDSGFAAYAQTHRPVLAAHFREALPDVAPSAPTFYRRYRSARTPSAPDPQCIVIVQVEFDRADEARQKAWVDAVFEALESDAAPPSGGLGAHFHVSADGTRVLNYAEWIDEASHRAALARGGGRSIGAGPKWQAVHAFPGVVGSRVTRYRFDRRLAPGATGVRS
jgi:hypothetical protein